MKLTYKILWFEDQFENVKESVSNVEDFVSSHGFIPEIEKETKISYDDIRKLASTLSNYNPYDLIIFDYDLGGDSEDGLTIAKELRRQIYTDLIFYSGTKQNVLRKKLYDSKVDGVFIIDREIFNDQVEALIEDHIKKISDINNIRGVVMSSMSHTDVKMRDSFNKACTALDPIKRSELLEYIKEKLKDKVFNQSVKVEKITCVEDAIKDPFLTEFQVIRVAFKKLFEEGSAQHEFLSEGSNLCKTQSERNKLAHQHAKLTDEGKLILHSHGGDEKEYNFDEFKRLRMQLLKIQSDFKKFIN
ncbi:MAG: hypothetical protein DIZ80_00380 [endosymbiont of Galathealinum brachiosum]|uniref:Uncharacterized protein n=1 Tax=endosymbiont of Galathealinum brachiosum TaxID=2200906 RepID=A0A370DNU1_9GAMM|nr:MAG: hypothetical protein DIZ80_00380 [endosymbiont of Galathealinum brachiosum]